MLSVAGTRFEPLAGEREGPRLPYAKAETPSSRRPDWPAGPPPVREGRKHPLHGVAEAEAFAVRKGQNPARSSRLLAQNVG